MSELALDKWGTSIDDAIKAEFFKIADEEGLNPTQFLKSLLQDFLNKKAPQLNNTTEAALQEAKAIMEGKIKTKSYSSARELFDELDKELEEEEC